MSHASLKYVVAADVVSSDVVVVVESFTAEELLGARAMLKYG